MNRCPITYEEITSGRYSKTGLNKLNPSLNDLRPLPLDWHEQIREARQHMTRMSIPGVQPKLNAQLSVKDQTFRMVDKHGSYLLKPELMEYKGVPANEDLTMRMAAACGIEVPFHGLIYARDDSMLYFIRRFDRTGRAGKIHVEDFAQVAGMSRETKYDFSMEKVVTLIEEYCTFPMVEKMKLFRRTLFCWLTGNEDMHLKNFSLIHGEDTIALSPAYDLLNTTIVLENPMGELALPLRGKHSNLTRAMLFDYFGMERLGLNRKVLDTIENELKQAYPEWERLIGISYLSEEKKRAYIEVLDEKKNYFEYP